MGERPQRVFVLGMERSGSSWLANIIDSNDENILFFEPFAPLNRAFPGFPDRLIYLDRCNPFLKTVVREGFEKLYAYKYPLLDRHDAGRVRRFLSYQLSYRAGWVQDVLARGLGWGRPMHHVRYRNLNKNRIQNRELLYRKKRPAPSHVVVKELRFNLKVGLLQHLYPDARFVVIIRNPLAQVNSCLTQFEEGALYQLKHSLYALLEYAGRCTRFADYRGSLDRLDHGRLIDRLVAYWFLNYNTLLEDLEAGDQEYLVVRHEDLSEAPLARTRDLFAFMGLRLAPPTERYVEQSSRSENTASSVLDTRRDSKTYYLKALEQVEEQVQAAFFEAAEGFWERSPGPVRDYRTWLRRHL